MVISNELGLAHTTNISAGSILAKERKIGLINEISETADFEFADEACEE